jgi:hypothetical protein
MIVSTIFVELYTDSVFRYEPFGIFPVFFIPKPKGNSVGKFGIIKLAGALYTHTGAFSAQEFSPSLFSLFEASAPPERSEDNNNKQQTTKSYEIRRGS